MDKFWDGLGAQLTAAQSLTLFGPALVFWAIGVGVWVSHVGFTHANATASPLLQGSPIIGFVIGAIIVIASALVVQWLEPSVLRLLEGYWPNWRIVRPLVEKKSNHHSRQLLNWELEWQTIHAASEIDAHAAQQRRSSYLDQQLRLVPPDTRYLMPTRLGNILRAAELRPLHKYGLDTTVCWSRLWLILPQLARDDLTSARSDLNLSVRVCIWSALILIWAIWSWWVIPVAAFAMFLAYRWALNAAEVYGDLLESAFDLHRFGLYRALCWPLPTDVETERWYGERLTSYLFRGLVDHAMRFSHEQEHSSLETKGN